MFRPCQSAKGCARRPRAAIARWRLLFRDQGYNPNDYPHFEDIRTTSLIASLQERSAELLCPETRALRTRRFEHGTRLLRKTCRKQTQARIRSGWRDGSVMALYVPGCRRIGLSERTQLGMAALRQPVSTKPIPYEVVLLIHQVPRFRLPGEMRLFGLRP